MNTAINRGFPTLLVLTFFIVFVGIRLVTYKNTTLLRQSLAIFKSPNFRRSHKSFAICLRFRYLCFGPGKKTLGVYQNMSSATDQERPLQRVWEAVERDNYDDTWKFGQVALTAVTQYRVRRSCEGKKIIHT